MGLSNDERRILATVNTGASSLSLLGSGFIVLCYLLFKDLRKFSFKLVFLLALSDMLCSFFNIIGDPSTGFFCYAQGYSTHFFCVASFLWTTTIAFTLHRTVVQHKTDVEDFEPVFHLYVWGTSLVMTIMRSIGNHHGHIRAWCWSQTGLAGKVVHFGTFYGPLWGAILYNGFTYLQVIRMLKSATRMAAGMSDRELHSDARSDMRFFFLSRMEFGSFVSTPVVVILYIANIVNACDFQLQHAILWEALGPHINLNVHQALNRWGYYPLILIGSWAFATINRIHDFLEPGHKIFWLSFLDVGTAALMGLFNSIAYGLNSSVRRTLSERLDLFFPERFRRWDLLLRSSKFRGQRQESELVPLRAQEQQ